MEKLTSMVDFVLYQGNPSNTDYQFSDKVMAYANFLKQPLELWMFIPCKLVDSIWVVLEKPIFKGSVSKFKNDSFNYDEYWIKANNDYEEAKDRVLFEGFRVRYSGSKTFITKEGFEINLDCFETMKIEDISNNEIELTPTALKQIGL